MRAITRIIFRWFCLLLFPRSILRCGSIEAWDSSEASCSALWTYVRWCPMMQSQVQGRSEYSQEDSSPRWRQELSALANRFSSLIFFLFIHVAFSLFADCRLCAQLGFQSGYRDKHSYHHVVRCYNLCFLHLHCKYGKSDELWEFLYDLIFYSREESKLWCGRM